MTVSHGRNGRLAQTRLEAAIGWLALHKSHVSAVQLDLRTVLDLVGIYCSTPQCDLQGTVPLR